MSGEHAWISGMAAALDADLATAGVTAKYALIGYGNGLGGGQNSGRTLAGLGTLAAFTAATASLVTSGGTEDGYVGLNYSFSNLAFTAGAARNYILVTDEDRDNTNAALTYASILAAITGQRALLNAVINNPFSCSAGTALGVDSKKNGYQADGSGGFTTCGAGTVGNGAGTTETDYADLALAKGSAAWDLNQLRAGGNTAKSFTAAFVKIKVGEIIIQPPGRRSRAFDVRHGRDGSARDRLLAAASQLAASSFRIRETVDPFDLLPICALSIG